MIRITTIIGKIAYCIRILRAAPWQPSMLMHIEVPCDSVSKYTLSGQIPKRRSRPWDLIFSVQFSKYLRSLGDLSICRDASQTTITHNGAYTEHIRSKDPGRSRGHFLRKLGRLKPKVRHCLNEERERPQLARDYKDRTKNLISEQKWHIPKGDTMQRSNIVWK